MEEARRVAFWALTHCTHQMCGTNVRVVQVIHMVNNTLPKLSCHTCRNKFHSGDARYLLLARLSTVRVCGARVCQRQHGQLGAHSHTLISPCVHVAFPPSPCASSSFLFLVLLLLLLSLFSLGGGSLSVQVVQHVEQECMPTLPVAMVLLMSDMSDIAVTSVMSDACCDFESR